MSDKETAPWIKKAAAEIVRMVANQKHEPDCEVCIDVVEEIIAETFAGECTAPAPLYRRDEDGTISVVNEAATPQVTPTERSDKDCLITSPTVCPQCGSGQQKYRWCIQLRPHQISNESCRLCDNQWHEQTEEPQSSA
jgi:hypothetical protein